MLMEPIILVFIKLMGAAISGHWDLGDTGTTRDYDTLAQTPIFKCKHRLYLEVLVYDQ